MSAGELAAGHSTREGTHGLRPFLSTSRPINRGAGRPGGPVLCADRRPGITRPGPIPSFLGSAHSGGSGSYGFAGLDVTWMFSPPRYLLPPGRTILAPTEVPEQVGNAMVDGRHVDDSSGRGLAAAGLGWPARTGRSGGDYATADGGGGEAASRGRRAKRGSLCFSATYSDPGGMRPPPTPTRPHADPDVRAAAGRSRDCPWKPTEAALGPPRGGLLEGRFGPTGCATR